ncbi:MAG: ATP-binding cassette domain-containing protein [Gammaproteobacteria bacterium]
MAAAASPGFSTRDSVLTFDEVTRSFVAGERRVTALNNVNLQLKSGRITGLIGPDGAGKTTLMRLAAALLLPDSGKITVLDQDTRQQALAVQSSVGYMPQQFGLYEDLTVMENLDLYADLQGVPVPLRQARYSELMQMTGLEPFTQRQAGRLSGGMKQKLGLACTLIHPPRLLLLDEPTVGVDPVSRRELWAIISRFISEEGTTVFMSTGYLDEAERCNELVLLHQGQIIDHGRPEAFNRQMAGRTYRLSASGMRPRQLQQRLARLEGVVDTVIQGGHVRTVMQAGASRPPVAGQLSLEPRQLRIEPVVPRFEDSFVALLSNREKHWHHATAGLEARASAGPEASASEQPVIEVQGLCRRFGDFYAVNEISFEVCRGEIFGLLGANGAGKTTTFRMLCGLLPLSSGQVCVASVDLRQAAATARARIGYMAQRFALYGNLSVNQNLRFFARAYGLSRRRERERIDWAIEHFQLAEVLATNSGSLSLGYKQRLAMACALMHEPEILFLDEPTSGVDPLTRRDFWGQINALAEQGVTVLVTTHFMEEAEYCDRLIIMSEGRILSEGTSASIKLAARSDRCPEPTMEDAFITLIGAPVLAA